MDKRIKMNKMELHEEMVIKDIKAKDDKGAVIGTFLRTVMRVPGGWLYTLQITGGGCANVKETFVPSGKE